MKSENKIFREQKNLENIRQLKAQMQKRKLLIQQPSLEVNKLNYTD